uniref:t-SNARE coiled-coil homology domain-containing protein n=1 Tax=Monopterus albus TaxID=43700 RepID=A0A3Q3KM89_MONAL
MSMEDPFFVVKGEVQKAVNAAQSLHHRWSELLQEGGGASKEEMDWTTNELRNSLRSIEFFLTVNECIVESNPKKFNLDTAELSKRKAFIASTRQAVKEMKEQMSSPAAVSVDRKNKQALLGERGAQGPVWQRIDGGFQPLLTSNWDFTKHEQRLIVEQQDEQLELVSGTIGVLKNMSERIGMELDEQAVMLDDFGHEMDNTQSRLDNVMKKLAKVSHMTSDRRQWCAIGVLLTILFVVVLLFFIL